ncbi:MAG: methyltransferase domain-containing protein [candidate division Zixibacteria bacterium]|nr:methyltransferase domain-containing protein [candidate division Zixibacteria bacterium]
MAGRYSYYSQKLAAEKLVEVYEVAPPRVKQYLNAEIEYVKSNIHPGYKILELGCGYGRAVKSLANPKISIFGIDTSLPSLMMAGNYLREKSRILFAQMDAINLGFTNKAFDLVFCIQNGISAFHVDQLELVNESCRVTKKGGTLLFSSYSPKFWEPRLEWFEIQSRQGLLGEIDYEKTGDGTITCKDGFTATTINKTQFAELTSHLDANVSVEEVDESSLFCKIIPE